NTISDVVMHIRHTARDGGALLRSAALQQVKDLIACAQAAGSVRLFSLRHEFAAEWARFLSQTPGPNRRYELALTLRPEHYPFWSQGRLNGVVRVDLFAQSADDPVPAAIDIADRADKADAGTQKYTLTKFPSLNELLVGKLTNVASPAQPAGELKLFFDTSKLAELWLAVTWSA